jgi:TonB family protein
MVRTHLHWLVVSCLTLAPLAAVTGQATPGQSAGGITLTVRDSSGTGIAGAELLVGGAVQKTVSDVDGVFHLVGVISGPTSLRVRRLGFRPGTLDVEVEAGQTVDLVMTLAPIVQPMAPIVVRGTTAATHGRLAGFYRRRETNGSSGRYFTRDQIDKANLHQLTDLFRRIPGMQISQNPGRSAVRMRGAARSCWPLVWLDGSPLSAGEFDLDNIQPNSLDAIEVYSGPASVPPEFMGVRGLGSCGVVVLWSRVGEPRPKRKKNQVTPAQLAELVASLKVYTADQVDRPARPDSSDLAVPLYPDSLYNAGVHGTVIAEFVVDTVGRVETETFGVVTSSHRLFAESVRRALDDATFIPAMHEGRLVRQVVQLPFNFLVDNTGRRQRSQ